jgi:hypothetical protein
VTIPLSGVRQSGANGGGSAMDVPFVQAKVLSIDIEKNVALCRDSLSRMLSIRLDIQRSKGQKPECGETWIVDKYYGVWTFAALMQGDTKGVVTPIENIPDLAPTLEAHQDNIDANAEIVAGMQVTITITNVQGTNKRYVDGTLSDGTAVTTVPCAGGYYPQVGDVSWVLRQGVANDANSTPSLICMGKAGVVAGAPYGQGTLTRSQIVAESALYLMADKRLTAPADSVYKVSRGFIAADGSATTTSWIDTVQYGADNAPLERNVGRNVGMLWGNGRFYFTQGDGTGRVPVEASEVLAANWRMWIDGANNSVLSSATEDIGIAAAGGILYCVRATNTLVHMPFVASTVTSDGDIHGLNIWAAGGLRAEAGLSCGGAFVAGGMATANSLRVNNSPVPAAGQIQTYDLTANNNIACTNTIFYRGGTLPATPSERRLKDHIENLGDPWPFIDQIVAARYRWLDTEHFDDRTHVGIYVDEMAEADPDTVQEPSLMGLEDSVDAETAARWRHNHGRHPDERALIAYLVRAVQDLNKRLSDRS